MKHWSLRFLGFFTSTAGVASLLGGCFLLRTPGSVSGLDSMVVVPDLASDFDGTPG